MRTGLHALTTRNSTALLDYYRRSGAKVCKVMEFEPSVLAELRAMGVTVIGRVYESDQRLGNDGGAFMGKLMTYAREYPWILWEGYNEAFQEGRELAGYAEFEIERMKRLEEVGAKAIIGNFSLGRPSLEDWPLFRPALEYAHAHGHALGKHEYAGPFMQWLCGENQWDWSTNRPARIDDPCLSPTVEGWLCLRYRKDYALFRQWGLGGLPLYITEGGIDDCQPRPGQQGRGYKDFEGTAWSQLVHGDYARQRYWYMRQASRDPFVMGVVDFGWDDASGDWTSFDLSTDTAMVDRIIAAESVLPVGHFTDAPGPSLPVPPPLPTPVPTPASPVFAAITVLRGEGWIGVARRAGVPVEDLRQANAAGGLHPGQALRVPGCSVVRDRSVP